MDPRTLERESDIFVGSPTLAFLCSPNTVRRASLIEDDGFESPPPSLGMADDDGEDNVRGVEFVSSFRRLSFTPTREMPAQNGDSIDVTSFCVDGYLQSPLPLVLSRRPNILPASSVRPVILHL